MVNATSRKFTEARYVRNFSFQYGKDDLKRTFQNELRKLVRKNWYDHLSSGSPNRIFSGSLILDNGYPLETGISFLHTHKNFSLLKDPTSFQELPILAWSMALKEKAEHAKTQYVVTQYEHPMLFTHVINSIVLIYISTIALSDSRSNTFSNNVSTVREKS